MKYSIIALVFVILGAAPLNAEQAVHKAHVGHKTSKSATSFGSCWSCMHGCTREQDLRLCGKRDWDKR